MPQDQHAATDFTIKTFERILPFTPQIYTKYLGSIYDKKATGFDGISVKVLKRTWLFILRVEEDENIAELSTYDKYKQTSSRFTRTHTTNSLFVRFV